MDSPDPFRDASAPPIPPKSPERVALLKRREIDLFGDDAARFPIQSHHSSFTSDNPAIPVKSPRRNRFDEEQHGHESDGSNSRPPSQRERYSNPYSHGEAAEYGNHVIAKLNAGGRMSSSSSGTEDTRSHGTSELDSSYVHPFAKRIIDDDPFADPKKGDVAKIADGEESIGSRGNDGDHSQRSTARLSRSKESSLHDAPAREQTTPAQTTAATLIGEKRSSFRRKDSSSRRQKLLKTAIRQNFLLEQEGRKTELKLRAETPQRSPSSANRSQRWMRSLHNSTSSISNLITRREIPEESDSPGNLQQRNTFQHSSFWKFFVVLIVGAGSAVSSFAVALNAGKSQEPSTGLLIWMICSVICVIIGISGCICVWGFGRAKFVTFMSRAGMEELGLMPSFADRRSRRQEERDEDERVLHGRMERVEERRRAKDMSVRTDGENGLSQEWRMLYHPQEENRRVHPDDGDTTSKGIEMQMLLRNNSRKHMNEVLKKSDTQADNSWLTVGQEDIGSRFLTPTRVPQDQKDDIQSRSLLSVFKERIKSTQQIPLPKRTSTNTLSNPTPPVADEVVIKQPIRPFMHRKLSHNLSQEFRFTPELPHSHPTTPQRQAHLTHSPTVELYSRAPPLPLNHSTHSLEIAGTPVQTASPLETLARQLNTPELRSLSADKRVEYFSSRREISEENGRRVKESLELKRIGSMTSGKSVPLQAGRDDILEGGSAGSSIKEEQSEEWRNHRSQMGVLSIGSKGKHNDGTASTKPNDKARDRIVATITTTITASPHTSTNDEDISSLSIYSQPSMLSDLPNFPPPAFHRSTSSLHSRPSTSSSSNQFLTVKATGPLISERLRTLEQRVDGEGGDGRRSASFSSVSLRRVGGDGARMGMDVVEKSEASPGWRAQGKGEDVDSEEDGRVEQDERLGGEAVGRKVVDVVVDQQRQKADGAGASSWLIL